MPANAFERLRLPVQVWAAASTISSTTRAMASPLPCWPYSAADLEQAPGSPSALQPLRPLSPLPLPLPPPLPPHVAGVMHEVKGRTRIGNVDGRRVV